MEKLTTYARDVLHIMVSKLLTPEETLNTREMNQKRLVALLRVSDVSWYVNWSVVAVILEKKVAIVDRARYRVVSRSSSSSTKEGKAYDNFVCEW